MIQFSKLFDLVNKRGLTASFTKSRFGCSIICPAVVITEVESSSIHKYNKTCRRTLKDCIMKKKNKLIMKYDKNIS